MTERSPQPAAGQVPPAGPDSAGGADPAGADPLARLAGLASPVAAGTPGAQGPGVAAVVTRVAQAPHLAIALDFDGVLAPLGDDPMGVRMVSGAAEVLAALAARPDCTLALISGRRRSDIVTLASPPVGTLLATSHGAEHGEVTPGGVDAEAVELTAAEADLLTRLDAELSALADLAPGAWVERKPFARVLHTRQARSRDAAAEITATAVANTATWPGVHAIVGKEVVEHAVRDLTKADGVAWVRERAAATAGLGTADVAVLFAGDDRTDEDALAALGPADLGVKVGEGETRANLRVPDEAAVIVLLQAVLAARPA